MLSQKAIVYACTDGRSEYISPVLEHLSTMFNLKFERLKHIIEVIPLLSKPEFIVDYIILDVNDFYAAETVNVFEIVNTLSTIIKCTVYREDVNKKPVRRNTKIIGLVDKTTPVRMIKEMSKFQEISFLSTKISKDFNLSEIEDSIRNFLEGNERVPRVIQNLIKTKKDPSTNGQLEILLTPRQSQIHNLVSTRGVSNKVIAKTLGISESTVKLHVSAILKKYGVKNRTQLAAFSKKDKIATKA